MKYNTYWPTRLVRITLINFKKRNSNLIGQCKAPCSQMLQERSMDTTDIFQIWTEQKAELSFSNYNAAIKSGL